MAYVNRKGLRKFLSKLIETKFAPGPTYLRTIFAVPKTWATKRAENTNIENVSTPTRIYGDGLVKTKLFNAYIFVETQAVLEPTDVE